MLQALHELWVLARKDGKGSRMCSIFLVRMLIHLHWNILLLDSFRQSWMLRLGDRLFSLWDTEGIFVGNMLLILYNY